jgi:hypothetical protein
MKRSVGVILTCFCLFFLPPCIAAQQHQHVAAHVDNVIDGSREPTLVPDSAAYRLYLLTVSLPPNATDQDRIVQAAHLAKIKDLGANDRQALVTIIAGFRSQYESWKSRWNAAATAQGDSFDPTPFLQEREDLLQSTRTAIGHSLSVKGVTQLDAHIQREKKFMKVAVP